MLLIPDGGVYTLKLVDSDHTIEVFYAEDKLGGGEGGDAPDQIPDYQAGLCQVRFRRLLLWAA